MVRCRTINCCVLNKIGLIQVKAMQSLATVSFTKNLLGNQQLAPWGIFEIQGRAVMVFVCSNNVMSCKPKVSSTLEHYALALWEQQSLSSEFLLSFPILVSNFLTAVDRDVWNPLSWLEVKLQQYDNNNWKILSKDPVLKVSFSWQSFLYSCSLPTKQLVKSKVACRHYDVRSCFVFVHVSLYSTALLTPHTQMLLSANMCRLMCCLIMVRSCKSWISHKMKLLFPFPWKNYSGLNMNKVYAVKHGIGPWSCIVFSQSCSLQADNRL